MQQLMIATSEKYVDKKNVRFAFRMFLKKGILLPYLLRTSKTNMSKTLQLPYFSPFTWCTVNELVSIHHCKIFCSAIFFIPALTV
jgi:hypothetical protein